MFRKLMILALVLPACTPTVVTDYNGHSIRIQSVSREVDAAVVAEAQRVCAAQGLQAEFASTFSNPTNYFHHTHLFLCLPTSRQPSALNAVRQTPPVSPAPTRPVNYFDSTSTL